MNESVATPPYQLWIMADEESIMFGAFNLIDVGPEVIIVEQGYIDYRVLPLAQKYGFCLINRLEPAYRQTAILYHGCIYESMKSTASPVKNRLNVESFQMSYDGSSYIYPDPKGESEGSESPKPLRF
jgi:hypothetical protein